jgi:Uma2 family endonuclease
MPETGTLTYADLQAIPWDGKRRELLDGELIVSPSPFVRHQRLVLRIGTALAKFLEDHGGGEAFAAPLDVVLSDTNVVEPDVFFVPDRLSSILTDRHVMGVPSLVIEVVSDSRMDRVRKRDIYARFGVAEYWVVDPDADRVEVYRLAGDGYARPEIFEAGDILTVADLPDFALDLSGLFRR